MLTADPLDELDAGEILPVTHGLLEQSLVSSGEVAIDLVRYNTVIPDSFLPRCGSSAISARCRMSRSTSPVVYQIFRLVLVVELDGTETSIVKGYHLVRRVSRVTRERSLSTLSRRLAPSCDSEK